jgi:hypothetical protein
MRALSFCCHLWLLISDSSAVGRFVPWLSKVSCLSSRRSFLARIQICILILKNQSRFYGSDKKTERKHAKEGDTGSFSLLTLLEMLAPFMDISSKDASMQQSVQSCIREVEKAFSNEQVLQAILGSSHSVQKSFEALAQRLVMQQVEMTSSTNVDTIRSSKVRRDRSSREDEFTDATDVAQASRTSDKPPRRESRRRERERQKAEEYAETGRMHQSIPQGGDRMSVSLDTRALTFSDPSEDAAAGSSSRSSIGVRGLLSHRRDSASSPRAERKEVMSRSFGGHGLRDSH